MKILRGQKSVRKWNNEVEKSTRTNQIWNITECKRQREVQNYYWKTD